MRFSIHQQGIEFSAEIRKHVEIRMRSAVERFTQLTQFAVYFADVNCDRGGIAMQCRAIARLKARELAVIEDHDSNIHALVDRVADRVELAVLCHLERERFGKERIAFDGTNPRTSEQRT